MSSERQPQQPEQPERLPEYLERAGIETAVDYARQLLRVGAADVPDMPDVELLNAAAAAEHASRQWPPDVLAALMALVYEAEIVERARVSRETDRKRLFLRQARKVGFQLPD